MSIKLAATYGTRSHVVAVEPIRHPMADEISIALGDNGYCNFPYTVELAFFKNGEWVTDILSEFAAFADGLAGDTLVYARVPVLDFAQFITNYGGER
jgi:hypothetical protein